MGVRLFQNVITYAAGTAPHAHSVISVVDLNQAGKVPNQMGARVSVTGAGDVPLAMGWGFAACWDSAGSDIPVDASDSTKRYYIKSPGQVGAAYESTLVSASLSQDAAVQLLPLAAVAANADAYYRGFCAPYMAVIVEKTLWSASLSVSVTVEATG